MDRPPRIKKITVKSNEREMNVFIPQSNDDSYNKYLEEAETEKTTNELNKKPPRPTPKASKEEIAGALREYREFKKRGRKYF
jgi:hypothetical protein